MRIKELIGEQFCYESLRDKIIELRKPLVISPDMNLLDLLKEFRKGKSHMAFITEEVEVMQKKLGLNRMNSIIAQKDLRFINKSDLNKKVKIMGIITLEDVIEEMINIDIKDEDEYFKEKQQQEKNKWFNANASKNSLFTFLYRKSIAEIH